MHAEIQEKAKASQEKHEAVIRLSREIDEKKKLAKESWQRFSGLKQKFIGLDEALKEKLASLGNLAGELEKKRTEKVLASQAREEKRIEQKEKELEEKMKSGRKLTNDDLVALQRSS